jgi:NitT/TauT family transport system ATP-binding protein
MDSLVQLNNVSKDFVTVAGTEVHALKNINLEILSREFLTIVGSSGSGKSTLIQLIAGIEKPTTGAINFTSPNNDVRIGFVFQQNTVFPWRTVESNLAYPLELEGKSKSVKRAEAERIASLIGLNPAVFLKKYPRELSGGEVRRVAIGMAIAHQSNLLIMDEPTSQLDFMTRFSMQQIVQELWLANAFAVVYVTHDIDEALILGDRVLIMQTGTIKDSVKIDLPRPRGKDTLSDPNFIRLQTQVLNICESR